MKVAFIVYHDLKTEARSQEILACAKMIGKEIILVSPSSFADDELYLTLESKGGYLKYFHFVRLAIKTIKKENPDIIILHDNTTAIILRWLIKKKTKKFIIYDSSELYINTKKRSLKEKLASFMNNYEKKYLKYADLVIAANIERAIIMKDYFELSNLPIVFDNIHKITDQYDLEKCNEKYGQYFEEQKFYIVYGGGIAKSRRTFDFIDAVINLGPKYVLLIAGSIDNNDYEEFKNIVKNNEHQNVHYLGFLPRNEWRYLINKSHITASAFQEDTVNNINCASGKVYESLFEGKPVLTSENPPLKRLCVDDQVGVSNNDFYNGILELERNYNYYLEHVDKYIKSINYDKRIDILADTIKEELKHNK